MQPPQPAGDHAARPRRRADRHGTRYARPYRLRTYATMTAAPTSATPSAGSTTAGVTLAATRADNSGAAGNASILPDALRTALEQAQAQVNGLVLGKAQA